MTKIVESDIECVRELFQKWWQDKYHNGNPPRFGWAHWRDGEGYSEDDDELQGLWEAFQAAWTARYLADALEGEGQ